MLKYVYVSCVPTTILPVTELTVSNTKYAYIFRPFFMWHFYGF